MKPIYALLTLVALTTTVYAVDRPTEAVPMNSCVTAECHVNIKQYKVVHGPVNVNACDACHKLTDAKEHKFEMQRDQTQTCTFCHKVETSDMPVVHKPVAQGECLSCHNPHGGTNGKFTRGATQKDLCNRCHEDVMGKKKVQHGPAAAGSCNSCHMGHGGQFKKLLVAEGKDLCFNCHLEMKTQLAQVKVEHKALDQGCASCHDSHASDFPKQVRQPPADLCTSCHEHDKIKKSFTDSKHKHSVVTKDNACMNCHNAHGGDVGKLMKGPEMNLCLKCHSEKIEVSKDRAVQAVAEVLDPNKVKHGPVRDGQCGGCHNVHGSDVGKLLTKAYPETFYQSFALEKYDLCFSCHDKQLVLQKSTPGLTGFRNGKENLHYLHVNKTDKGRNCRACHNTHASDQPLHIRESVPYGNWQLPINYKRTTSGGSCSPGCHKPYDYDRDKPVRYDAPTTAPAAVSEAKGK